MIEPIVIKVVDKVPVIVSGPQYVVCDNSDYTVVWQLDEEWAQFEHRTMQVNYKDGTYERVLFTGNTCALPALPVSGPVHVGLFAGDIHTTRPARLLAVRSATTDSGEERDPMPNGYAQAIEALDGKLDKNQGTDNAGKALVIGDDGNVVPGEVQGGSSLPAMSSDTAGKMLTNDGDKAEWGGAVRYDTAQNLLVSGKQQARLNIGAFPGRTLQYFFDTTTGSEHDNDIVAAREYDVISPGNTYSDGSFSNAGMAFPLFVLALREVSSRTYFVYAIDVNGVAWNTVYGLWTGVDGLRHVTMYDCSKVVDKQSMCVNFTKDADGNWSADKNWDDAAALIEAGGWVYVYESGAAFPVWVYQAKSDNRTGTIRFHVATVGEIGAVSYDFEWSSDGSIEYFENNLKFPDLSNLPFVSFVKDQGAPADNQAIARKNIGLDLSKYVGVAQQTFTDAEKAQARENIGAEESGAAAGAVSTHNTAADAHSDIRLLVEGLTTRLNALANSDDTTLDQMAEVVAYIKANRELIESITTAKVNVSDIIDNLTTNASNKPLSAAQGVALKALIDAIESKAAGWNEKYSKPSGGIPKTDLASDVQASLGKADNAVAQSDLQAATDAALAQAKASGEFDGAPGKDGADGTPGADGTTPHIGTNGNWFVGETDTGVPSKGEQGPGAEVYYVDLTGTYPSYTCATAMADIAAAYAAGKELKCRCAMSSVYTAVLPLFLPLTSANTWVFSGAGALTAMGFPAQSLTVAIINGTVQASDTRLANVDDIPTIPTALKNPNALTVKIGSTTVTYDGSSAQTVEIADGSEVSY